MRPQFVVVTLIVLSLNVISTAQQRQRERPAAITDPAEGGVDYTLQGEYAGTLYTPGRGSEFMGLQVVALGGGKFDAVLYRGGPPGNGWDRSATNKLSGEAR